jgi:hypothetical protein
MQTVETPQTIMTLRTKNLLNLLQDIPHNTTISIQAYTKDGSNIYYGISSGSLQVINRDILTSGPFSFISIDRSERDLGKLTVATLIF